MFRLGRWLCQGNVFVLIFDLVQHAVLLCFQRPLVQLFPAALADSISHCSVYPSLLSMGAIMFAVATGTTMFCSLDRQYVPVLSLSFYDVYGAIIFAIATCTTISWSLDRRHGPALGLFFLDASGVCTSNWQNYFLQPRQAI